MVYSSPGALQPTLCNEPVGDLSEAERNGIEAAVATKVEELFDVLMIDYRNDNHTRETPRRVAAMLVEELLEGRYTAPPAITEFENVTQYDELIVTGPIDLRSTCAHHLMPIYGEAYIGILAAPDGKIIGLSKYDRVVNHFASRLQIQEELAAQIGQYLVEVTKPRGLGIRISAVHMCKTHRGVRSTRRSRMISSCYFGEFLKNSGLKEEFLRECASLERACLT